MKSARFRLAPAIKWQLHVRMRYRAYGTRMHVCVGDGGLGTGDWERAQHAYVRRLVVDRCFAMFAKSEP